MTDEERQLRIAELIAKEAAQPPTWWVLSFADANGFLGATIVRAPGMVHAIQLTIELGINAGGEVAAFQVVHEMTPPPAEMHNKLIRDKARCEALCEQWAPISKASS